MKQFPFTWDSAVYLGMGKYLFSLGTAGLWEPIRPLVVPAVLGLIWKTTLNPLVWGRMLEMLLSVGSVYLLYLICKELFSRNVALLSALVFSFSGVLLRQGFNLHTGIPATFFLLGSVFLFLRQRILLSGLLAGLAFITRFYYGIFLIVLLVFLIRYKNLKLYWRLLLGFGIPLLPYLIVNLIWYHDCFHPFTTASWVIGKVAACNYFQYHPWYYYFLQILRDNPLHLLSLIGLGVILRKPTVNRMFLLTSLVLPLSYLSSMHCREARYMLLFLPFLVPLTAIGIDWLMQRARKTYRLVFLGVVVMALVAYPLYGVLSSPAPQPNLEYYHQVKEAEPGDRILTNNPKLALYSDHKLELLYYPLYNASKARNHTQRVAQEEWDYVFIDNCYGDLACKPGDLECRNATEQLMSTIREHYSTLYHSDRTVCQYYVFQS